MRKKINKTVRKGLVLSGGGSHGYAHLGVLKAFKEKGIDFDMVSGCSAGALIGLFYAGGFDPDEAFRIIQESNVVKTLRFAWSRRGLFRVQRFEKKLMRIFPDNDFENLKKALVVSVTDLNKGGVNYLHSGGNLITSVLASCAIPLVFEPVHLDGCYYVDGGFSNNLPAEPLADECDLLVGINVLPVPDEFDEKQLKFPWVMHRVSAIMARTLTSKGRSLCDFLVEPEGLEKYSPFDLSKADEIFEIGYREGLRRLEDKTFLEALT
ncbi:hypothetical protein FUAX_14410 [Fulvitalea axinellae]|uniref:PNPLA domain-containing protein n=1 Tax=Fulvitalea axinellae TaxID=1182444 RepID=A0AAU9CRE3_9BACT|nr:hypothetical protein FUAX_14410 [Fulvitalea axinellae]